jgi:dihydropteroate synthase
MDCRGRPLALGGETRFVGIVNVTPDSFSDGGRFTDAEAAVAHAVRLVSEGAAMIDLGGQSTRPGHAEIDPDEEIGRVIPVLRRLVSAVPVPISIDTYKPAVARAALAEGAHVLNDVRGFQGDPELAAVAAEFGSPAILMHNDAGFASLAGDAMVRIRAFFARSLEIASAAGVAPDGIILDPGIGFGKTQEQNLEILARLGELRALGRPILLGASRKSVIGRVLGGDPAERLEGTLATTVMAVEEGVELIRVHDVLPNLRAARMAEAVRASVRRPGGGCPPGGH